ncbi:MAG: RtcB family protein, partial [Myxococcales bacterium]|nr:RtcB family protein [Myxococcales bacterium]
ERLLDPDLAYFLAGTPEMDAYRRDLDWAQRYAWENRRKMLELVLAAVSKSLPQAKFEAPILCHHNYVAEEVHFGEKLLVTRKGAISAKRGLLGIIPGSMGARSYVVRGLGHAAAFESASHGAGRRMSREQAKKRFSLRDLEEQTQGIECRKDRGVLDEIPGAYKDIEEVMARQKDLVEIVHELRQVVCVKG